MRIRRAFVHLRAARSLCVLCLVSCDSVFIHNHCLFSFPRSSRPGDFLFPHDFSWQRALHLRFSIVCMARHGLVHPRLIIFPRRFQWLAVPHFPPFMSPWSSLSLFHLSLLPLLCPAVSLSEFCYLFCCWPVLTVFWLPYVRSRPVFCHGCYRAVVFPLPLPLSLSLPPPSVALCRCVFLPLPSCTLALLFSRSFIA